MGGYLLNVPGSVCSVMVCPKKYPELLGCHIRLAFLEFPVYLPEPGGEVQWLVVDLIGFCGIPFTDDNALPVPVPEFGYDFGFCRAVNELPVGSRFLTTCSYADLWLFLAASTKKNPAST